MCMLDVAQDYRLCHGVLTRVQVQRLFRANATQGRQMPNSPTKVGPNPWPPFACIS